MGKLWRKKRATETLQCVMSYRCFSIGQVVKCVHVLKSENRIHAFLQNNILSYRL